MNGSETHLNNLTISNVENLQNLIWRDILPPKFFPMLKKLVIYKCNLANFSWVLHLPCLFYLKIQDCAVVGTLFYVEEEREIQPVWEVPMFPSLKYLYLSDLPYLVSITNFALDVPRLSLLSVSGCPNLRRNWHISTVHGGKAKSGMHHLTIKPLFWLVSFMFFFYSLTQEVISSSNILHINKDLFIFISNLFPCTVGSWMLKLLI